MGNQLTPFELSANNTGGHVDESSQDVAKMLMEAGSFATQPNTSNYATQANPRFGDRGNSFDRSFEATLTRDQRAPFFNTNHTYDNRHQ